MVRLLLFAISLYVGVGAASAETLDRIKAIGKLNIGYRVDAVPFSYKDASGQPAGYMVDLCRLVAEGIKRRMKLAKLDIEYVPVTTEDRFEAIRSKKIDLLCGATTVTLSRRRRVDFSVLTFFTGASVMIRADGPASFNELDGGTIAVRAGTTTERALEATLKEQGLTAKIVAVEDHANGVALVEGGKADAYFADRAILLWLVARSKNKENLAVAQNIFGPEPYAIAMPRGDWRLRLMVDRQLSAIYRSKAIVELFDKSFPGDEPTETILTLYLLNALPE